MNVETDKGKLDGVRMRCGSCRSSKSIRCNSLLENIREPAIIWFDIAILKLIQN